jgi:hypothetical protein
MQRQSAIRGRTFRLGWLLPALIALSACANTSSSTSATAPSQMRVAGGSATQNGTQSVDAVSDALGQRLDAMVTARQAPRGASR